MKKFKNRSRIRSWLPALLVLALAGWGLQPAHAAGARDASPKAAGKAGASSQPKWVYPVIAHYGGVHPRPDVAVRPDPKVNYHIFVDVVSDKRNPAGQFEGLIRLARLVNLMAYAKVPADHVHIVALLDGKSGWASAADAMYRQHYHADNPNLPIIHALSKAGVKLLVCSQALAENGLPDKVVDPAVTITLSGLTDPVVYGQRGYTYMQL